MSALKPAPIAVSLGDPAGVGPELIIAAWSLRAKSKLAPFFVVGGASILAAAAQKRDIDCPIIEISEPVEAAAAFARGLPVIGGTSPAGTAARYTPGQPDSAGARMALASLDQAARLAVSGRAGAMVTAPIAKAELAKVGFAFPGQTEFLAKACGMPARNAVMMLAGPSLRTVPLTVHCPLAEVASLLSIELICDKARIVAAALARDFGIEHPRLAIAGLNPHAGESGRMGREETDIIAPAIAVLRQEGINVTGPHPADTLFAPHKRASYDLALAMYHDQALIPLKALDFDQGVNVTLGLPIIRTSPDHGTAFDIAGTGVADPGAMIAAIRMASEMAARRTDS